MFNEKGEPDKNGKYSIHPGKFEKIEKEVTKVTEITDGSDYEKITNSIRTVTPVTAYNWIEVTNGNPYATDIEIYKVDNLKKYSKQQ